MLKHSSVYLSQIQLADVVLLNKTDLLENEDDIQIVIDFLAKVAPGIRVVPAKYGVVPLQTVLGKSIIKYSMTSRSLIYNRLSPMYTSVQLYMVAMCLEIQFIGVSPSDSGPGVVTHDRVEEAFKINAHYSDIPAKQRVLPLSQLNTDHLTKDAISSIVFTSFEPFSHFLFQQFLKSIQHGYFGKIIRIKGTIWFQNSNERTFTFNFSGRMRFDLEMEPALHIKQQSKIQLVIIGKYL